MDPVVDRRRRRLLIATVAGGSLLLGLVSVGVYGLVRGPDSTEPATRRPGPTITIETSQPSVTVGSDGVSVLAALSPSGPPEVFARRVAEALFAWDTASGFAPVDYAQVLADVASPVEADFFVSDVRAYLPTIEAWGQLRAYQTRQWLTIDTISVPASWEMALAQAAPGQIPDGTTAYTVDGTRHRAGIVGVTPAEAERGVSFTVFVTCTPPIPDRNAEGLCGVLRLSELNTPLR